MSTPQDQTSPPPKARPPSPRAKQPPPPPPRARPPPCDHVTYPTFARYAKRAVNIIQTYSVCVLLFAVAGKRAGGVGDSALLKQLKAFIKEEMGRQTEDLIEELKLLHDKQRNDRFRATADDRKERQKNTLILAEMESMRTEVSKLRRDIKNIFRIPGKQSSSSSRHATQKRDKRSGRHR